METATLPIRPTVRQALLGILRRPAAHTLPGGHLHFDRNARVWRSHEEREPRRVEAAVALPECA